MDGAVRAWIRQVISDGDFSGLTLLDCKKLAQALTNYVQSNGSYKKLRFRWVLDNKTNPPDCYPVLLPNRNCNKNTTTIRSLGSKTGSDLVFSVKEVNGIFEVELIPRGTMPEVGGIYCFLEPRNMMDSSRHPGDLSASFIYKNGLPQEYKAKLEKAINDLPIKKDVAKDVAV